MGNMLIFNNPKQIKSSRGTSEDLAELMLIMQNRAKSWKNMMIELGICGDDRVTEKEGAQS